MDQWNGSVPSVSSASSDVLAFVSLAAIFLGQQLPELESRSGVRSGSSEGVKHFKMSAHPNTESHHTTL